MWQHTLDEVQTATVEVMERKENKHVRKDHQFLIMRFYSTTGCHMEDCPSADTNSTHIVKETDEELGEREGDFQSTELLCSSMEKRSYQCIENILPMADNIDTHYLKNDLQHF